MLILEDDETDPTENTFIEADVDPETISKKSLNLPAGFYWSDLDLNNDTELTELYTLLSENYVEDDESMFRFDYAKEFLKW